MAFFHLPDVKGVERVPGVSVRSIWGERVMISMIQVNPNIEVPKHQHDNEQAGYVLKGEVEMTIGGEKRVIKEGDSYVIPSGLEHGAIATDKGALVLDIFSPPREDYK